MVLVGLLSILSGKGLSFSSVPRVKVVTVARVIVTPLFQAVFPLRNSNHLVEWVDIYVRPVSCGDVDKVFSHPIRRVKHILKSPVYSVLPVTDHLPCAVLNLARFDVDSLSLVDGVSGKCSPVLNILGVDEVLAPSDCVVCSPVLARLINSDCALVQLVSQHSYLLSQHSNFFPGSESGNPVGNRNLNSFPYDLLNGLVRHIEGVSGTENV